MLSAGERPQLPVPSALVNSSSTVPVNRVHAMPDLEPNGTSAPAGIIPQKGNTVADIQHIWVVTGPAGCGKSTVGQVLRNKLDVPFLEGDDVCDLSHRCSLPSESNNFQPPAGVVVACSALKKKYRDVMRVATYGEPSVQIHFVYLKLTEAVLMQRVTQRQAHYMKSDMVKSQLAALEEPRENEWDAITINVEGAQEQVQQNVLDAVAKKLAEYS
ncbi:Shikimate kinase [Penicillium malachiteum]|uniref:Shikimate kinase n=1 Tax=Penicillium malachiteum TaxID=1324776 RepID=UPI002546B579|nr:Shikimate kinase [Penicillium malachiteum]KAJ5729986.1 Shikimate kinase [Penicillium malachiteum]